MSYRLPVLVSDIPANKEIMIPGDRYFKTGDKISLKDKLEELLSQSYEPVNYDMSLYDWDNIAKETAKLYDRLKTF